MENDQTYFQDQSSLVHPEGSSRVLLLSVYTGLADALFLMTIFLVTLLGPEVVSRLSGGSGIGEGGLGLLGIFFLVAPFVGILFPLGLVFSKRKLFNEHRVKHVIVIYFLSLLIAMLWVWVMAGAMLFFRHSSVPIIFAMIGLEYLVTVGLIVYLHTLIKNPFSLGKKPYNIYSLIYFFMPEQNLKELSKLLRYYSLTATTAAGSGHPTSSMSAADLMAVLFFGGFFRYDIKNPVYANNDRLIFSKGHASPLFYALWAVAGGLDPKELKDLRKLGSRLEGHPTMRFPFTETATGSLGQGLSIGVGMALNAKLEKLAYKTFVLLGDSEMAEGSIWEAMQSAVHYKLDNLVGILDVNRLGQRGETMYGHKINEYKKRVAAFGWKVITCDGHKIPGIMKTLKQALKTKGKPVMIIAKTLKGKGVKSIENKDGWHGKALKPDELEKALKELGSVDETLRGNLTMPKTFVPSHSPLADGSGSLTDLTVTSPYSTRKAYGDALVRVAEKYPDLVVLDAEVSNSTFAETFMKKYPKRFFEMYIAEQNMVGVATGLARRGKIPFVSTFSAFFSRAFDQIRMSQYSESNIKFCGSHAGVSIGEDGASQMGLEDIALFRTLLDSVVLYPADAVAVHKLVDAAAGHKGNVYIRTTRADLPVIYEVTEEFTIGGSKVLHESKADKITVVGAGITLYEALAAYDELKKEGIAIRVIDLYSIKPIDYPTLHRAIRETQGIIVVEDHFAEGGIGEAVRSVLHKTHVHSLAVRKMPMSGKPAELLAYEEINKDAIIAKVKDVLKLNVEKSYK